MEAMGIISKVDETTPWCAGMVVVPKRNGKVRICVDLKPLNESVLREVHPLPRVDETLARLTGAKVFSKLDANSGFLANSSCLVITPANHFHYPHRSLPLQQTTIWDFQRTGTFPKEDVQNPQWPGGSGVPDG